MNFMTCGTACPGPALRPKWSAWCSVMVPLFPVGATVRGYRDALPSCCPFRRARGACLFPKRFSKCPQINDDGDEQGHLPLSDTVAMNRREQGDWRRPGAGIYPGVGQGWSSHGPDLRDEGYGRGISPSPEQRDQKRAGTLRTKASTSPGVHLPACTGSFTVYFPAQRPQA